MKSCARFAVILSLLVLAAPLALSAEFEPDADGPWISVDVIDLVDYGNAAYFEYLGQGYVAFLDALKAEGLILDYGVMERITGDRADGDVVIWYSVESLAAYEKANERMATLAGEMRTAEEWGELWAKLENVRTIKSSNIYRAVLWNKVEE